MARKLAAAVWHVLMGHMIGALEPIERLRAKLFKLATEIGVPAIKAWAMRARKPSSRRNSTSSNPTLDITNHMSGARGQVHRRVDSVGRSQILARLNSSSVQHFEVGGDLPDRQIIDATPVVDP